MNNVHFAIPEIYGDSLSYYEVLRELIEAMNVIIDNYDTIPEQIADAVKNLDAAQLFSAVLNQLIDTIATDNTKSNNAVKVYKKHDLLYATFNETVNLYEAIIDFTPGTETELIPGTNIREVNISELFIELRKLIGDETQTREQGDNTLQNAINTETAGRVQADTTLQQNINTEVSAREQADTTLHQNINAETSAREQADTTLQQNINAETSAREHGDTTLQQNISAEESARKQADNTKVNKSDVLTLEEIQASSDLSGKIASASALKISTGTATKGENASSVSVASWTKFGRVVVVTVNELNIPTTLDDKGNGYKILKNLPKPVHDFFISANYFSNTRLVIDTEGNLKTWWSTMTAGTYVFSFTYISKE